MKVFALATVVAMLAPACSSHDAWVLTPRGLGPLYVGMTRAQAEAVVGSSLAISGDAEWKDCAFTPRASLPPGIRIMVENGTIARIDVDSNSAITTVEGVRVGDSEARVHSVYAGRVTVTPQKYTTGHYMTVRSAAAADSLFRMIFETDGRKVLRFRGGRVPAVEYVESCG
jgi:hypothetical protein